MSSQFSIKDKVENQHQHNVVYEATCPECPATYIGETGRRISERITEHASKDKNSHLLRHSKDNGHKPIDMNNVKIIGSNYKNYFKRKISEALFIKQKTPSLNVQDMSIPLHLFN